MLADHPEGLTLAELTAMTGMTVEPVKRGIWWMRQTFRDEISPVCIYDETDHCYRYRFPARLADWRKHAWRNGQHMQARMRTLHQMSEAMEVALPAGRSERARLRTMRKTIGRLQEDLDDLLVDITG